MPEVPPQGISSLSKESLQSIYVRIHPGGESHERGILLGVSIAESWSSKGIVRALGSLGKSNGAIIAPVPLTVFSPESHHMAVSHVSPTVSRLTLELVRPGVSLFIELPLECTIEDLEYLCYITHKFFETFRYPRTLGLIIIVGKEDSFGFLLQRIEKDVYQFIHLKDLVEIQWVMTMNPRIFIIEDNRSVAATSPI